MTKERLVLPLAIAGVLAAAALAVLWAALSPDRLGTALIGGLTLPVLWGAVEALTRGDKTNIRHAVVVAAMVLIAALGLRVGQAAQLVGSDDGRHGVRLAGILGGLVMAYFGNRIPKLLERFDPQVDFARRQAFQRHAGWIFVLAGLASALAWAVLPIDGARLWGTLIVAGGLLLVLARLVRCHLKGSKAR